MKTKLHISAYSVKLKKEGRLGKRLRLANHRHTRKTEGGIALQRRPRKEQNEGVEEKKGLHGNFASPDRNRWRVCFSSGSGADEHIGVISRARPSLSHARILLLSRAGAAQTGVPGVRLLLEKAGRQRKAVRTETKRERAHDKRREKHAGTDRLGRNTRGAFSVWKKFETVGWPGLRGLWQEHPTAEGAGHLINNPKSRL